jgi:hypothetical protein
MWQAQEFIRRIGTVLRIKDDAHEPLPQRWIDLIHHLNEKEWREERVRQREAQRRQSH